MATTSTRRITPSAQTMHFPPALSAAILLMPIQMEADGSSSHRRSHGFADGIVGCGFPTRPVARAAMAERRSIRKPAGCRRGGGETLGAEASETSTLTSTLTSGTTVTARMGSHSSSSARKETSWKNGRSPLGLKSILATNRPKRRGSATERTTFVPLVRSVNRRLAMAPSAARRSMRNPVARRECMKKTSSSDLVNFDRQGNRAVATHTTDLVSFDRQGNRAVATHTTGKTAHESRGSHSMRTRTEMSNMPSTRFETLAKSHKFHFGGGVPLQHANINVRVNLRERLAGGVSCSYCSFRLRWLTAALLLRERCNDTQGGSRSRYMYMYEYEQLPSPAREPAQR